MEPQVISDLIRANVEVYRENITYRRVLDQERKEQALLTDLATHWPDIAGNWDEIKEQFTDGN